jgi:hypothetical protein
MLVGSLDVDIRNLLVDFMADHSFTFIFLYVHARGDLFDHESLVKAIKGADVVISVVGSHQVKEQKGSWSRSKRQAMSRSSY